MNAVRRNSPKPNLRSTNEDFVDAQFELPEAKVNK